MELVRIAYQLAVEKMSLSQPAGVVFWSGRKFVPSVEKAGLGVVIIWP